MTDADGLSYASESTAAVLMLVFQYVSNGGMEWNFHLVVDSSTSNSKQNQVIAKLAGQRHIPNFEFSGFLYPWWTSSLNRENFTRNNCVCGLLRS